MKRVLVNGAVVVAVALFVAGFGYYVASRPDPSPATNTQTYGRDYELPETEPVYKPSDLPKGVQTVAGQFILAAAGREDLAKAWRLTHPELRAQCGCTYKQWLKGDIPVQYYPSQAIDTASFEIDEITPREIYMRVLAPPEGGRVGEAAGLRHRPQGPGQRAPRRPGSSTTGTRRRRSRCRRRPKAAEHRSSARTSSPRTPDGSTTPPVWRRRSSGHGRAVRGTGRTRALG